MKIITRIDDKFKPRCPTIAALGYFDGLHIGHQRIIQATKKTGYQSAVITFANQPEAFIKRQPEVLRLLKNEHKIEILEKMGVDYLFMYPFDERTMNMNAQDFVQELIINKGICGAAAGFNFTFGKNKTGNAKILKKVCKDNGLLCEIVTPVMYNNEIVSSTLIRATLKRGDAEYAAKLLGRAYFIEAVVTEGKRLGTKIGIPTMNMFADSQTLIPKMGVYESISHIRGEKYLSLTNVGDNPTIEGDSLRIETHVIDFDQSVYGQLVRVEFISRIRDQIKFSGIEELKSKIKSDIKAVTDNNLKRNILRN